MALTAILHLNDRRGSSQQSIIKAICTAHPELSSANVKRWTIAALDKMEAAGEVIRNQGARYKASTSANQKPTAPTVPGNQKTPANSGPVNRRASRTRARTNPVTAGQSFDGTRAETHNWELVSELLWRQQALSAEALCLMICTSTKLRDCGRVLSKLPCKMSPISIMKAVGTCGEVLAGREPFRSASAHKPWYKIHTSESSDLVDDSQAVDLLKSMHQHSLCWRIALFPAGDACAIGFEVARLGDPNSCFAAALFNQSGLVSVISRSCSCTVQDLAEFVLTMTLFGNLNGRVSLQMRDSTVAELMADAELKADVLSSAVTKALPLVHPQLLGDSVALMVQQSCAHLTKMMCNPPDAKLRTIVDSLDFAGVHHAGQLVVWDREWATATKSVLQAAEVSRGQLLRSFPTEGLSEVISREKMDLHLEALNKRHNCLAETLAPLQAAIDNHPIWEKSPRRYIQRHFGTNSSPLRSLKTDLRANLHNSTKCGTSFTKWVEARKAEFATERELFRQRFLAEIATESADHVQHVCSAVPEDLHPVDGMMELLLLQKPINKIGSPLLEWTSFARHDLKELLAGYCRVIRFRASEVSAACRCGRWDYCDCWHDTDSYRVGYDYFEEWMERKLGNLRVRRLLDISVCGALCYILSLVGPLIDGEWLEQVDDYSHETEGSIECWSGDVSARLAGSLRAVTEYASSNWAESTAASIPTAVFECKWWILCLSLLSARNEYSREDLDPVIDLCRQCLIQNGQAADPSPAPCMQPKPPTASETIGRLLEQANKQATDFQKLLTSLCSQT